MTVGVYIRNPILELCLIYSMCIFVMSIIYMFVIQRTLKFNKCMDFEILNIDRSIYEIVHISSMIDKTAITSYF